MSEKKARKRREVSDVRTIPGSKMLKELAKKAVDNMQALEAYNKDVTEYAEFKGISIEDAKMKFKAPEGATDTITLRKNIRLAIQFWDQVGFNPQALVRITNLVAEFIPEGNRTVQRNTIKNAVQNDLAH